MDLRESIACRRTDFSVLVCREEPRQMLQALAMVVGVGPLTVHEILTRLWKYLNQHDLTDGQMIQCDTGAFALLFCFAAAFQVVTKFNDFIQIYLNERLFHLLMMVA